MLSTQYSIAFLRLVRTVVSTPAYLMLGEDENLSTVARKDLPRGQRSGRRAILRVSTIGKQTNDECIDALFWLTSAWIPIKQCFVLSKEYPSTEKKKITRQFELSLAELQSHIEQLRQRYGAFTYAPSAHSDQQNQTIPIRSDHRR